MNKKISIRRFSPAWFVIEVGKLILCFIILYALGI